MKIYQTVILVLSVVLLSQVGFAQYGGSPGFSSQASLSVTQYIQRQELRSTINRRAMMNRSNRLSKNGRSVTRTPIKKVAKGPSSFIIKDPILPAQFVKSLNVSDAEKRSSYQMLVGLWKRYENVALKDGFPSNDLAYVFNHYLVNNYIVYINYYDKNKNQRRRKSNGQVETDTEYQERINLNITVAEEKQIYGQYRAYMDSDATIKKMTNEQKQLFAELLVTLTNVVFTNYEKAYSANDRNQLQVASNAAKSNLENFFGVSVDRLKITKDGLRIID